MWIPWVKKSPAQTPTKSPTSTTFSFDINPPLSSPIHHHSPSLKDIDTLLHNPPPFSPLHKHSLSSKDIPFSPARSPAHYSASFKDIHSLLYEAQSPAQSPARKPSVFHRVRTWAHRQAHPPPDAQNRVVIYYTSLRVVRRTYEDCRVVRSIMKGYRVKMDERDLAMDGSYVEELQKIMGQRREKDKGELNMSLPKVYVNGKYVGGVEEIRRLHENGELKKMIQGLPVSDGGVCEMCGGFRYVVCEWCDGSHRVFVDDKYGFKSCSLCNVNGLIHCRNCTTVVF